MKRKFYLGSWQFGTAATNDFWRYYTFDLATLPSNGEFTTVFDEYRIRAIKVEFRPETDGVVGLNRDVNTATTAQNTVSWLHTCIDPMSTVVPTGVYNTTTINTFLENSGVRSRRANKCLSVYFKPILTDGVTGTGTAAARVSNKTWLRVSDLNATYRGFHALWQTDQTALYQPRFHVFITYYMQFKNLR